MNQKEFIYHIKDIKSIGIIVAARLKCIKALFLFGNIGVGKTTLVKHIIKALGGNQEEVTSPTFSLQHIYHIKNRTVYHVDLYRVQLIQELYHLGFEEILNGELLIVEWGEFLIKYMHREYLRLDIKSSTNVSKRKITLNHFKP